jgi:hypothetical protein
VRHAMTHVSQKAGHKRLIEELAVIPDPDVASYFPTPEKELDSFIRFEQ